MKKRKHRCYRGKYERLVVALEQTVGYQISKFNIPDAWLETQGEGIVVAILDTGGSLSHPDLAKSLIRGKNFTTDDSENIVDGDGHATHCAGIITANNNNIGMVGVAPLAEILVVKVLDDNGEGYYEWIIDGIYYALSQKVNIISMSLGGEDDVMELHDAIKEAYKQNVPVVCAVGNSGKVGRLDYPANYMETISIGATDEFNNRTSWSQTGENLDFMAPGASILSTVPHDNYAIYNGTSMSAPWAAGVIALMMTKHRKKGGSTPLVTVEDVREHLKKNCIDMNQAGRDPLTGYGLVDVKKAIEEIKGENKVTLDELKVKLDEWVAAMQKRSTDLEVLKAQLAALEAEMVKDEEKKNQVVNILNG